MRRVVCLLLSVILLVGCLPIAAMAADTHPASYINSGDNRTDIIGVARTQVGYYETGNNRTKYGAWYGLNYNPWCAMYISWCARLANVPQWIIQNSSRARPFHDGFGIPYYDGATYTPSVGDIFFKRSFEHTGFVYHVDGDYFYSIEGNSNNDGSDNGNRVLCLKRKISDYYFGVPVYVTGTAPAAPQISTEKKEYYSGQTVDISWTEVENAKSYYITVYCNGDIVKLENVGKRTSYKVADTKAGDYLFSVSAIYPNGTEGFAQHAVTVKQAPRLYVQYNANGGSISPQFQYLVSNSGGVAFRANYTTSSAKLGMIPVGTFLQVYQIAYYGGYEWGQVYYNGRWGWCALNLCQRVGYGVDQDSNIIEFPYGLRPRTYWNAWSGETKALMDPQSFGLTKAHHTFVGWTKDLDGSAPVFTPEDTAIRAEDISASFGKKDMYVTVYALWDKIVEKIAIETLPTKTTYYTEETLDPAGLQLRVSYQDGTEELISSGFTFTGFDSQTAGTKEVTVNYKDQTAVFEVTVDVRMQYAVEDSNVTITGYQQGSGVVILPGSIGGKPVTKIGAEAFSGCDQITGVIIPASITQIGENAFAGCRALTTVNYTGSQEQWDNIQIESGNELLTEAILTCDYLVLGDFTGDMKVDNNDVLYLLKHSLFPEVFPVAMTADLNADGSVDNKDVILLLQHSLFPDMFPLTAAMALQEEAPAEDVPVEETPAEEAPVEETPAEEAPVEETPVEEAPVEETPVEEAPTEETPAEETPVAETSNVEITDGNPEKPEADPDESQTE